MALFNRKFWYYEILQKSIPLLAILAISLSARSEEFKDQVYRNSIQTVLFQGVDPTEPYPVISLTYESNLTLKFDDLDPSVKDFEFTIIHCNYEWEPSDIPQNQYIEGIFYDYIPFSQLSYNTYVKYNHYEVEVPNANMKPRLPGNYVLKVYSNGNPEDLILTRRFFVVQYGVNINTNFHRPSETRFRTQGQEIDFTVDVSQLQAYNPSTDFKIMIRQNGRWDNAITNLPPRFFANNELSYNYDEENVFLGLNEFRVFDTRNIRFGGQMIQRSAQDSTGIWHAYLYSEESRESKTYLFYADVNGHRVIDNRGAVNSALESDYITVHFRLVSTYEEENPVYLVGSFSNWQALEEYRMEYDERKREYRGVFSFKQGYYNYFYGIVNNDKIDFETMEGSFFETENDYELFFYQWSVNLNCDLLLGYKKINTVHQAKD